MSCIFCQIAKGEMPCYKIYEDKDYLAFLDIFPLTKGHTLVIPKKHYPWVWQVEPIGPYFKVCQKIAKHFQKLSGDDQVFSFIFGSGVAHAHIRIAPVLDPKDRENIFKSLENIKLPKLEDSEAIKLVEKLRLK